MDQFSQNFLATMLHSLWQSALLLAFYGIVVLIKPRLTPLSKRNLLFTLLLLQIIYSSATFYLLSSNAAQGLLLAFSNISYAFLQQSWLQQYSATIFLLYAIYVCGKVCANYLGWMQFKAGNNLSLAKTSPELRLFTLTQSLAFGIKRKVSIWHSHSISSPMTFGFWKPVILLPAALVSQLSTQQVEALIIHELTHIKYKDYLLNWGLIVVETIFFFNPFIRFIAKQIRLEREKNCDVQVLHFKYGNIIYAEALLKACQVQQQLKVQLGAVNSRKQLFNRIHFFCNPASLKFQQNSRPALVSVYALSMLITMVMAVVLTQKPVRQLPQLSSAQSATTALASIEKQILLHTTPAQQDHAELAPAKPKSNVGVAPAMIPVASTEATAAEEEEAPFAVLPVANELPAYDGKEIIIKDEGSDGKTITAAYYAVMVDGVWTLQPLWLLTEVKGKEDSLNNRRPRDTAAPVMRIIQ